MIEVRTLVKWYWTTPEFGESQKEYYEPVLQFRAMSNFEEIGIQEPIWNEWEDVEVIHEQV